MPDPERHWRAKRRRGSRRLVSTREYPSHRCRDLACQIAGYTRADVDQRPALRHAGARGAVGRLNDKPWSGAKQTQTRGRLGPDFLEDSMGRLKSIAVCAGLVLAGIAVGFQLAAQGQAARSQAAGAVAPPTPRRCARSTSSGGRSSRRGASGRPEDRRQGHLEPHHAAEGAERDEAGQERDRRIARARRAAGGRGRRQRRRHLPPVTNAITDGGTTDNYQVSYHGQTVAHIDTLVPLLRERADVQRRAREGQHHGREPDASRAAS